MTLAGWEWFDSDIKLTIGRRKTGRQDIPPAITPSILNVERTMISIG